MIWRASLKHEEATAEEGEMTNAEWALGTRLEELERSEGEDRAGMVATIAYGKATPLVPLADGWLEGKTMKPRQRLGYRLAAGKLEAWLMSAGHPPTIEAVTKPVASDYRASLIKAGMHPRTANKDLSVLSGLWRYAEGRGVVADGFNPWRGQTIAASGGPSAEKRPFKDEEIATLLSYLARPERTPQDRRGRTPMQALIHDAVQLLALSGMRLEEMARMKVGHLRDLDGPVPYIDLRGTKTKAARRQVPIHPDALPIILRRAVGKGPDAYVLHELTTPPPDSTMDRRQPITKEFGRIKRLGVDEREDGARTSNIDLHSLRRWFVRSAATALEGGAKGYSHWTIAEVVGHAKEEMALAMTMGRYAGDGTMEARAACVRAVRLPGPS
jgi:integrase